MQAIDRILQLMVATGVKGTTLAGELGLSKNAVSEWKSGKAKPSTDAIMKIAQYFGVTTDYLLLGETAEPTPDANDDDVKWGDFRYALYSETEEMTNEQQQSVLDFVRFVKAQGKHTKDD